MKIKTPISGKRLRTHFTYYFWIYLIIIVGSVFLWDLLYAMTAYRSPEDKRIDVYIQYPVLSQERAEAYFKPIWEETVPDMEVVDAIIMSSSGQEYYGTMQLTVYIMAQEGDVYILSSSDFKSFASQGVFLDLQSAVDDGRLDLEGIDVSAGFVATVDENGVPSGERKLFGIPAAALTGFKEDLNMDTHDMIIAITDYNGNDENVIKFVNGLIQAARGQSAEN